MTMSNATTKLAMLRAGNSGETRAALVAREGWRVVSVAGAGVWPGGGGGNVGS